METPKCISISEFVRGGTSRCEINQSRKLFQESYFRGNLPKSESKLIKILWEGHKRSSFYLKAKTPLGPKMQETNVEIRCCLPWACNGNRTAKLSHTFNFEIVFHQAFFYSKKSWTNQWLLPKQESSVETSQISGTRENWVWVRAQSGKDKEITCVTDDEEELCVTHATNVHFLKKSTRFCDFKCSNYVS